MATSSSNVLSPESILVYMNLSLPAREGSETPPVPKDPYAAIALFSHACMLAAGFRLVGLGEEHKIEAQSESEHVQPLPAEWDASSLYAFRYAHSRSSMEYLVKVSRLGTKALVFGVGLGDDKTASFEIKVPDYISDGSLRESSLPSDRIRALRNIFISDGRISDLASLFKINIIHKLAPGVVKAEPAETQPTTALPRQGEASRHPEHEPLRDIQPPPARPYPFEDPLAAAPRRPTPPGDFPPPGFEDEYEINRRPPYGIPGRRPSFGHIGERDLYPPGLGPHDPLRIGPGGGGEGGGGMHPTFDDPIFGGHGGERPYDPQIPPGSRYDPVGPGDGRPNLRGGPWFPRGRGGGSGGNPFGGFGRGDFI